MSSDRDEDAYVDDTSPYQKIWEDVNIQGVHRVPVPGGWLYRYHSVYGLAMTFVPDPNARQYIPKI